jgi:hypothetical protein
MEVPSSVFETLNSNDLELSTISIFRLSTPLPNRARILLIASGLGSGGDKARAAPISVAQRVPDSSQPTAAKQTFVEPSTMRINRDFS